MLDVVTMENKIGKRVFHAFLLQRISPLIKLHGNIKQHTYIHTYHSRFIPEGVAEASQILLRDAHDLPKLLRCEDY
jgi:hypothetical protein